MGKPILVFPAGMPRALEYQHRSTAEGAELIGGSSLDYDPVRTSYPDWVTLPFVTSPDFSSALKKAIDQKNIGAIYTPNIVVWDFLSNSLKDIAPDVRLINRSPVEEMLADFGTALKQAAAVYATDLPLGASSAPMAALSGTELASLYRHANAIPGMCDNDKLRALIEMFRTAGQGDVVEVGSWWGKSAFILSRLAKCYRIGALLCVDPWANEHLVQGEALVDKSSAVIDAEQALQIFEINLLPYSDGQVNYLRMPSVAGAVQYAKSRAVETASFGNTQYAGRIAVLHIDGNHAYPAVKADIESWTPMVMPGGWIVIDDYIWPYGSGPRISGDEYLSANTHAIDVAFVMGSALFIRLKGGRYRQADGRIKRRRGNLIT